MQALEAELDEEEKEDEQAAPQDETPAANADEIDIGLSDDEVH